MEEVASGSTGSGVVIHLPVYVVKDFALFWVGTLDGEVGCGIGFVAGLFVDLFVVIFGDHSFGYESIFPEVDRIMIAHVSLDLFLGAIFLGIGVGDGMTFVTIGHDLQNGRS